MSTITLPNIRVSSDLTVKLKLKDGGVALDWSTLQNIKVSIYSDAQRALAGRCGASIDAEDPTLLVCTYAANKPQYVGVNRVVVSAKYMGETKTYDKPAFNFVRWTDDQAGEQITIDDPDIDVEISVEDVSSSILQEAVDAAFTAADRANDAAEAAEHMVDIHTGPQGEKGDKGDTGEKGDTGDAAGFGTVSAALQEDGGDPSVVVAASGPDTAKQFDFTFKNLKGDKGDKGDQGNSGYQGAAGELEVVNNLTDGGSTAALSAEMGKTLKGEVSQLEAKVTEMQIPVKYTNGYIKTSDPIGTVVDINNYVSLAPWMCYVTNCKAGDTVIVSGTGGLSPRLWAFLDEDKKIISQSASNATENGYKITAPQDSAFVIVNDNSGKLSYLVVDANLTDIERRLEAQESYTNEKIPVLDAKVTELDAKVTDISTESPEDDEERVQVVSDDGQTVYIDISEDGISARDFKRLDGASVLFAPLFGKKIRIFGGSVAFLLDKYTGGNIIRSTGATLTDDAQSGAGFANNLSLVDGAIVYSGVNIQKQVDDATAAGQVKADIYILWASTNDYTTASIQVGDNEDYTIADNFDVSARLTQCGGINYCIKKLCEFAPEAKVVVFGSLKCFGNPGGGWTEGGCGLAGRLKALVDGQHECAMRSSLPFFSLWENSGFNEYNNNTYFYHGDDDMYYPAGHGNDGTHPNKEGYIYLANKIINFLDTI